MEEVEVARALALAWVVEMVAAVVLQRRESSVRARVILEDFLEEGICRSDRHKDKDTHTRWGAMTGVITPCEKEGTAWEAAWTRKRRLGSAREHHCVCV